MNREVGYLYNPFVENANTEAKIDAGRQVAAGYMKDLYGVGNITAQHLSIFTAFFNPIYGSGGAFDAGDWEALVTAPPPVFIGEVNKYWHLGPYMQDGHRVDHFWTDTEEIQCTACTKAFAIDISPLGEQQQLGSTVYFGYLGPKSGNDACKKQF